MAAVAALAAVGGGAGAADADQAVAPAAKTATQLALAELPGAAAATHMRACETPQLTRRLPETRRTGRAPTCHSTCR